MDEHARLSDVSALDHESAGALLRAVFETGRDAMGVARQGIIEFVNPAMATLFGYESPDAFVGKPAIDLIAPSSRGLMAEIVRRSNAGAPVSGAYAARAVRKDGSEFDADIRSTTYTLHGEVYSLTFVRDASREREAERAARREDETYRAMFELNSAVKLLIDPSTGRIVDANPAAERFYGYTHAELCARTVHDINMLSTEEVSAELENARSGRRDYFRFRHRTARGDVRHVEVHSSPIQVAGKQLLFSILHDVTERDALEEQLRQAQRLEAIGRLAGGVAHDFNNLLTVMLGCCQLLDMTLPPDPLARDTLRDLHHAAQRAGELTQQLLAFSRRQLLSPRALSLTESVRSLEGLLRRTLGTSVEIIIELDEALPLVLADAGQIEQVIMNLALNGRDAMPHGGRLTLRTERRTLVGEEAGLRLPEGEYATLSVTDQGVGMDADVLGRVFEPFFTTKALGKGTGLGLSTVYGIVTQSGGGVLPESEPGRGSRFTVFLPVTRDASPSPPRRQEEPAWALHCTVLLVEDMADVRRLLSRQLALAGMEVVEADSAESALELPEETLGRVDALVTDVVLGGRSGIELSRALLARHPRVAVVLISGDVRHHELDGLPQHTRCLQKPFDINMLVSEVRAALAERND